MGIFRREVETRENTLANFERMFIDIQMAVSNGNDDVLDAECTQEMFDYFMQCKADNIRNRVKNVIENITIENAFTADSFYDEDMDQDFHSVHFQFNMSDYYVDLTGNIVDGSQESVFIEETWVFTRVPGHNVWLLASIEA